MPLRMYPDTRTLDEEFEYLRESGYTGALNDMMFDALGDLSYSSLSLPERLFNFGGEDLFLNVAGYVAGYGLDFTNYRYYVDTESKDFSDAITHSRAGNATMVDSDGVLKWAPHNLLTYSEQFDNAAWTKSSGGAGSLPVVTVNDATAPDGTNTADKIVFNTGDTASGSLSLLSDEVVATIGVDYTSGIWLKGETGGEEILVRHAGASAYSKIVLTTEWVRYTQVETAALTDPSFAFGIRQQVSGLGILNTSATVYAWGAHLYRSDLGGMVDNPDTGNSYVPTTSSAVYLPRRGHHVYNGDTWVNKGLLHESEARTNLITYSDDLTNAFWAQTSADRSQIDTLSLAPSGEITAQIVEIGSISTASDRGYYAGFSASLVPYTYSVFVSDAGGGTGWVALANFDTTGNTIKKTFFNLASGSVGTIHADHTANIEKFGSYYRISITFTPDGTVVPRVYFILADADNDTSIDITTYPQGTQWVKHYGAQLEAASTPSSYIPTSGATVTRAAETLTVPSANLPWPEPVVIGEELVTNGTFDTDVSGWFLLDEATASSVAGQAEVVINSGPEGIYQNITTIAGRVYAVSYSIGASTSSAGIRASDGSFAGQILAQTSFDTSARSGTFYFVAASSTSTIYLRGQTNGTAYFDNISVKEINPLSVSIQMQGEMTYADEDAGSEVFFANWEQNADNNIQLYMRTNSGDGGLVFKQEASSVTDAVFSSGSVYSPSINAPFNIASRHGSTFINGAVDGTALTEDTTPTALPDLSSTDLNLGYDYMGTISEFRIWADDLGDTGIAEASSLSLLPSLNLTFDGQSTSFTDTGMVV